MRITRNAPVWALGISSIIDLGIAAEPRGTIVYAETSSTQPSQDSQSCFTLSESHPTVTLDYGTEVGGFPLFQAKSISGPVQIEAKYTEAKKGLENVSGDGPWTFSNGLSNTFRVETFSVSEPGHIESYFIQGGLRWQQLRLLNEQGTIQICGAGIRSLNDRTAVDSLPGYFESSNSLYNEIWALGPRTVQQACIEKGAAPSTWEVTPDGVLLHGQQSAQSVLGTTFSNYTLSFMTKIVRGGTGWRIANGVLGFGPSFVLTTDYASGSTFINTNKTLLPANTLAVAYGWNLVNQTSLEGGPVSYYSLPVDVKEGQWIQISTTIKSTGYDVSINNSSAIHVPLSVLQPTYNYLGSAADEYSGTWGFGPYQDQVSYVKDVEVHAKNGTLLYRNSMTSTAVLEEYGVMPNQHSVCLDGAKRDRLVWSGDFSHTSRVIAASTYREDFINGTLAYLLDRQMTSGEFSGYFSMSPSMGQSSKYTSTYNSVGLEDYQMLLLNAFARYHLDFADQDFLEKYWSHVKTGVTALLPLVDSSSGLASGSFFLGAANGTAASSLFVYTLNHMAEIAENAGETDTSVHWRSIAASMSKAINKKLWNNKLGTYGISTTSLNETSIAGTAWAILADVADSTKAESAIRALSTLRNGIGYKTLSTSESSAELSPFISGFLLEALLKHSRNSTAPSAATDTAISALLSGLWPAMITNNEYYTGTSWEYVFPDGRPGLDLYTSHAHPWGGAPTFVFTEYVLGVQGAAPGLSEWTFQPAVRTPGVSWAKGRVPTPHGSIEASWKVRKDTRRVDLRVCSPHGTKGTVVLPFAVESAQVNGQKKDVGSAPGFELGVGGGKCSNITLTLVKAL
ncbi:uncharacterized protein N7511_000349 [Penicillium nucicola]|uniref:uncharacterized protein n=1 Tax=Penicillium nucicola TaxID=1850975 RepID=UPI0025456E7E|nr:uncharacterized protein N7511_000349 [Penicillium nucicola]KAJ5775338.1 hypothetical protein N7511_000349 [Penicillium nucicola]